MKSYGLSELWEPEATEGCQKLNLDDEDWLENSEAGCKTEDAQIYASFSKSLEE